MHGEMLSGQPTMYVGLLNLGESRGHYQDEITSGLGTAQQSSLELPAKQKKLLFTFLSLLWIWV